MKHERLIVIGNGMAGVATIEEILKKPSPPTITVFGGEPHVNYNRILLSDVLACAKTTEEIFLNSREWYEKHAIQLHPGVFITGIDLDHKQVIAQSGERYEFDKLLIATGSVPLIPPMKGVDKKGVFTFRNIEDTESMIQWAARNDRAVVIGGGLLGLEAARGLTNRGMMVTVVHLMGHLMEKQLDATAGAILKTEVEKMGIEVRLNCTVKEILGKGKVEAVRFSTGDLIKTDLALITAGIRPNVKLAEEAGLAVKRGILVGYHMQSSHPEVFAVGECVEFRGWTYGLVAPIMEQAKVAAEAIAGSRSLVYGGSTPATTLKVAGIRLTSMGDFQQNGADCEEITYADPNMGIYKKVVLQGNRVAGAILLGETEDGPRLLEWIRKGTDVGPFRKSLLWDGNGAQPRPIPVAGMQDNETVCGCMSVTKGTIVEAIKTHKLTDREGIGEKTRACTSCKSCGPLIDQLLEDALGSTYVAAPKVNDLCACARMTRQALRQVIQERQLKSYSTVKESGCLGDCGVCKPGVSFLLSEIWPKDYADERQARFINDRVHANIQKDGTFSVVPRIYGGVTSPEQLRRIADVAEKYNVRMVKITGGQRIDLLGVKKEDLPKIWADLDIPSGHAYAKAVRTVKTCVGSDFCRFGVGDSTALGIEMEKRFEGLYTPHKVKMAVSGCPRNCAESYVKDIGVVAIEGGWEVYVGGAAGMNVRKGDLLCRVDIGQEVLDAATKFLQYYRENGEYMERTYDFVPRIGIETIRRVIFNKISGEPDRLLERFHEAKSAVVDPWKKESRRPVHKRQFSDLTIVE
ncbi:MAG: NAD(P)/FAD-dependent oxidoreductase [Nitrospirae bacterium]|nr:NAD(P)/FAD-dependent oxidoreductase [Nitrospirota bacterium]